MPTINIPRKIEKELKLLSQKLGLPKEDLLLNALLYYFQALERDVELKKELEIWERTSDIDLVSFEKNL